jgi:hypothetical protein
MQDLCAYEYAASVTPETGRSASRTFGRDWKLAGDAPVATIRQRRPIHLISINASRARRAIPKHSRAIFCGTFREEIWPSRLNHRGAFSSNAAAQNNPLRFKVNHC